MRSVVDLFLSLEKQGYHFSLENDQLCLDIPLQGAESAVIERLKPHRAALQRLVELRGLIQQVGQSYQEEETLLQEYIEDRLTVEPIEAVLSTFRQLVSVIGEGQAR